jgi:hypothetical protein
MMMVVMMMVIVVMMVVIMVNGMHGNQGHSKLMLSSLP